MYIQVNKLIDIYHPNMYVAEYPADRTNASTSIFLTGLYCIGLMSAELKKVDTMLVRPTSVKKYIAGNGFATKDEVAASVCNKLGLDINMLRKPIYYRANRNGHKIGEIRSYLYDSTDALANGLYIYETCIK
jgi:Holliday junction resolvasome RuvABC endonuclease subunit